MIRIGTRTSALALWQADAVAGRCATLGLATEIIGIHSSGDVHADKPILAMGEYGVFTKELDEAVVDRRIDCAVHSLKDVPTQLAEGLVVAAVLERGPVHDVLVCANEEAARRCHDGEATIATSSRRRMAQWLRHNPRAVMQSLRGNVPTRVHRAVTGVVDGIIIAKAGLHRLGLDAPYVEELPWMVPAPAQGAVAVVMRGDHPLLARLASFDHRETRICVDAERAILRQLSAGCSAPLGAHAWIQSDTFHIELVVLSLDGQRMARISQSGPLSRGASHVVHNAMAAADASGAETILQESRHGT